MATAPLIGQNRAYYIPAFFGTNAAGGAGTPALSGATGLDSILAALLANFNPSIGAQNIPMGMNAGGDSGIPGAGTVTGGSETPVNPLEALGTLGTMANVASTAGTIGSVLGIPDIGTIGNAFQTISRAGGAYYGDAAREQLERQINAYNEASGSLAGNADLGRYGYDPSLSAAAQVASGMGALAGVPIIGGLAREGLMMAADPVPSTTGDLVRAGVDAVVPSIINAIITGLTGSTIGANIKGGMTPVDESIARTPEEVAREEAARVQNILDGLSAEGAPVETVVPTPVDQSLQNITAVGPDIPVEPEAAAVGITPPSDPGVVSNIIDSIAEFFGPTWAELTAGREAAPAAPPPAPPVAPVYGDSNYTVVPDLQPVELTNAIFNEPAFYESSYDGGGYSGDYSDYGESSGATGGWV